MRPGTGSSASTSQKEPNSASTVRPISTVQLLNERPRKTFDWDHPRRAIQPTCRDQLESAYPLLTFSAV